MAIIRVILGGCGIKYTDANGNARHVLKTPEDGPFECDDKHAESLVRMGMAEYVLLDDGQDNSDEEPENQTGHLEPAELELMTIAQLKKLAGEMGVDVSDCKVKADYVAALAAVEVEFEEVDVVEESDELPELEVADPE